MAEELRLTVLATLLPWNCLALTAVHPPTPQELQQIGLDQRFVDVLACLFSRPCDEMRGRSEPFGLHVLGHRNRSSGTVMLKVDSRYGKFDTSLTTKEQNTMNAQWSKSLQQQTLTALRELPVSPDGKLHMKHKNEGSGYFDLVELAGFKFVLHRKGSEDRIEFPDEQAVVAAGWAID